MSAPPLTHHEILALVAPFTRRGRHVDLAGSDRMARTLVFRALDHSEDGRERPALRELLRLEHPEPDLFELTRTLVLENGTRATLQTEGKDPAALLARIEAVEPWRQVVVGDGYVIALDHRLEPPSPGASPEAGVVLRLTGAVARLDVVTVRLTVTRVPGVPGDLELEAAGDDRIDVPEDLLAVLGWPWSRLTRSGAKWVGCLRLRGREPERSADAERKLAATCAHLVRTLGDPPARFHERLRAARWRVTLRRAVPLLVCLALVPASLLVPRLGLDDNSAVRMLLFHAPPLLLLLFVALPEMPRIEIPPLPRRLTAPSWRAATQGDAGA